MSNSLELQTIAEKIVNNGYTVSQEVNLSLTDLYLSAIARYFGSETSLTQEVLLNSSDLARRVYNVNYGDIAVNKTTNIVVNALGDVSLTGDGGYLQGATFGKNTTQYIPYSYFHGTEKIKIDNPAMVSQLLEGAFKTLFITSLQLQELGLFLNHNFSI